MDIHMYINAICIFQGERELNDERINKNNITTTRELLLLLLLAHLAPLLLEKERKINCNSRFRSDSRFDFVSIDGQKKEPKNAFFLKISKHTFTYLYFFFFLNILLSTNYLLFSTSSNVFSHICLFLFFLSFFVEIFVLHFILFFLLRSAERKKCIKND